MRVLAVQFDLSWHDKQANFCRVEKLLANLPPAAGDLVVLPEMFATGFSIHVDQIAEGESGPTHAFLSELARVRHSHVIGGVACRAADGTCYNESLLYDPAGRLAARYRKLQPFVLGGEGQAYRAGGEIVVAPCGEFSLAQFVCYDLRFPEVFRPAVWRGANLFTVIASWPEAREAHWLALLRARAIENQAYVVGVNRTGRDPTLVYRGHSLIVDYQGHTLAAAGEGDEVLLADLDLEPLLAYRRKLPFLADMREDFAGR